MLLCIPCTEAVSVMATEIASPGQLLSTITTVLVYLEKMLVLTPLVRKLLRAPLACNL